MADKFEDLRTYATVVETGGVNAAAAKLGIAKSATSRRLSDLETRLGVRLIERTTRRFELTETGRAFYRESRRILDDLAALEERPAGGMGHEVLTIDASPSLAASLLANPLAAFRRTHPELRVALTTGQDGEPAADVAIGVAARAAATTLVGFDRQVLAAPSYLRERGSPQSPADLGQHDGIRVRSAGGADWLFATGARTAPSIVVEAEEEMSALAVAIAGIGVVQLPSYVAAAAVSRGDLEAVMGDHAVGGAVVAERRLDAHFLAGSLIDFLVEALRR